MKIPSEHIDLKDIGYPDYWVEMPRSVKEGFLHEFAKMGSKVKVNGEESDEQTAESLDQSRQTNVKLLELVTAWNLDDDEGNVFPLMSKVKGKAERDKIVAELPIDIIVFLANRVAGNVNVPEKTKDF